MKTKAYAVQIADVISIRNCKNNFKAKLLFSDTDELFYELYQGQYIYIFKYGVISFYNLSREDIKEVCAEILQYGKNPIPEEVSEYIEIMIGGNVNKVSFGKVSLKEFDVESLRLIMLNVSQSVALDKYANISEQILEDTKSHTSYLEEKGRLDISGKKLKKYIGRVLNIKNRISENLYIFDSPDVTWDDERLNKLDQDLKRAFDLKDRYRSIHDQIEIIKENLELFKDIMFHRQSSTLEWIIIILILVEVVDLFIQKLT
ncbi:RMD1 family protein [Aquimarina gracilis]|uniref:RMD1 family protein n=1 Tax=Aquimarina gracilis TaxID=874422 RepID=A0ABU5ZUI9_9FLAO|nr:RMD1 family protein [Aquimarina gracilis]MEB3345333.1 RMD1 family protein [Aquimarina gracilis]